jgi:hypothetical protein
MTDMTAIEKAIDEFEEATRRITSAHYLKVTDGVFTDLCHELNEARNNLLELIKEVKNE